MSGVALGAATVMKTVGGTRKGVCGSGKGEGRGSGVSVGGGGGRGGVKVGGIDVRLGIAVRLGSAVALIVIVAVGV